MMTIIFNSEFYDSDYADNPAADPGRMEVIIQELPTDKFHYKRAIPAEISQIELIHTKDYIKSVVGDDKVRAIALLSAGAAIKAAEEAWSGNCSMSINRPPGHHAYKSSAWGYCYFSNMAIAITHLINTRQLKSAFILDFDAHTGDGTIDCLKDNKAIKILNPMGHDREEYLKIVENYLKELKDIDIVGVCAGFDSYEKDVGGKLMTFDFYAIGRMLRIYAEKNCKGKRFAVLEGGYYLPDLGKNVLAFCEGFGDE